jgi:hypothetical protein
MPNARVTARRASRSTRVKDLVDLVLIARAARLEYTELRRALERTFKVRGTSALPVDLPPPPPPGGCLTAGWPGTAA